MLWGGGIWKVRKVEGGKVLDKILSSATIKQHTHCLISGTKMSYISSRPNATVKSTKSHTKITQMVHFK